MASDRITVIRGRENGSLDWRVYRRGQPAVLEQGTLGSASDPLPAGIVGGRGGATTIALPASQVVMRLMTLPLHDKEELAGAIALQVDKFSPFPVEQMVYGYEVLTQSEEDGTEVLIAISQRASVAAWGDVLLAAGVAIVRVDCAALGLWRALDGGGALDRQRRESLLLVGQDEVVLITHDCGKLLSISGLGQPEDFDDAEVCADLAEEVARILMETDAENGGGRDACVVLAGLLGQVNLGALEAALSASVGMPVLNYQERALPDDVTGIMQRSMAGDVAALANLIPPEWVRNATSRRFRKQLLMIGGGLLGLWLLLLAGGAGYFAWERSRLAYLREAEQEWTRSANAVRSMRFQVDLVDRYRDRRNSALESLREISAMQPQGLDLTSFTYRKGDGIELIGEAASGALVLQFNERLNQSVLFGDVRPGTRTVTGQGRHRFSFEIAFKEVE